MNRLSLSTANQAIAILIFMAAAVSPLYSQKLKASQKTDVAPTTAVQTTTRQDSDALKQRAVESSEKVQSGRGLDVDQATGSRFALSAGGTPALPVNALSSRPIQAESGRSYSRFALSAGGTPAIPVNESLAQTARQIANQSSSQTTNQPPQGDSQTSSKQTPKQPYVFPTPRERFNRYVKSTVGLYSLLRVGISAGINQWRDNPEEWEQGASGFGKRYASGFGRNAIQQTVIYGLDSALWLDTGFRRSTRKGFFPRMKDALAENITSRTKTGKRVISVPRISGVYTSRIISAETWYPSSYTYRDGLRSGTRSLITGFGMNLIREFIIRF